MMHRDGSVFSSVSMNDLKNPDTLYRALGEKDGDGDGDAVLQMLSLPLLLCNFLTFTLQTVGTRPPRVCVCSFFVSQTLHHSSVLHCLSALLLHTRQSN
jgi:hypothetical protein